MKNKKEEKSEEENRYQKPQTKIACSAIPKKQPPSNKTLGLRICMHLMETKGSPFAE